MPDYRIKVTDGSTWHTSEWHANATRLPTAVARVLQLSTVGDTLQTPILIYAVKVKEPFDPPLQPNECRRVETTPHGGYDGRS